MVNSVSYPGSAAVDMGPKVGAGTGSQPAQTIATTTAHVADQHVAKAAAQVAATSAASAAPAVSSKPLVEPLTSLAIWTDEDSGMQVAVVRDRVTGQVVEQFPTERARRLAAMVKQQEHMAQELHTEQAGTTRLDIKT